MTARAKPRGRISRPRRRQKNETSGDRPAERGATARASMLEVAENLFGLRGLYSVSLREIAAAAGQRNNSAVGYHFRDRDGLVDALMSDRIGKAEAIRRQMIARAGDLSTCSAAYLLQMLWQPLLDIDKDRDFHSFVRVLLAYQVHTAGKQHPIVADPTHHPATRNILSTLNKRFAHLSRNQFLYRMALLSMMFWSAVAMHDQAVAAANRVVSARFSLKEIVRLAIAALSAPG